MTAVSASFCSGQSGSGASDARAALVGRGAVLNAEQTVAVTVLDTFDGRLHQRGMRLVCEDTDRRVLRLTQPGSPSVQTAVTAPPMFPNDLPPGPIRERLSAAIGPRALRELLTVVLRRSTGAWHDDAHHRVTIVIAEVVEVIDPRSKMRTRPSPDLWGVELESLEPSRQALARTSASLRRLGLVNDDVDLLARAAAVMGVDLAGVSTTASVPLHPGTPAADGFVTLLDHLVGIVAATWDGAIEGIDLEYLHDLRIALRQTRTVLKAGARILPPDRVAANRARFAWLARATGPTRDLDVALGDWHLTIAGLPPEMASSLDPLRQLLQERHDRESALMRAILDGNEARDVVTVWRRWLEQRDRAEEFGPQAERPIGIVAADRIGRAQGRLLEGGRAITADSPANELHDLRKTAKSLRYLVECFAGLSTPATQQRLVKRLKELQSTLGEHQDCEVQVAELHAMAATLQANGAPSETLVAVGRLAEVLDQRRRAARADFAERFAAYDDPATERALVKLLQEMLP